MINCKACLILCLAITAFAKDYKPRNCDENAEVSNLREEPSSERRDAYRNAANDITEEEIETAFGNCDETLAERKALEKRLIDNGRTVKNREADISLIHSRKNSAVVDDREKIQLPFEIVSCNLRRKHDLSRDDMANQLPKFALNGENSSTYRDECRNEQPNPQCDRDSRFRTFNGECNNLNNPRWGMATVCQRRVMPAYYIGNSEYRPSVNGEPLPEPRSLSLNLHYHYNRPTNYVTHMYMVFGQFLDHDIALTPLSTTGENEAIECCPPQNQTHPQCDPIILQPDDPFYSQYGITCMNFVRSAICQTCTLGQREQMNQVTSYIDGSQVYGNSINDANELRLNDGTGRLRFFNSNAGDLLPQSRDPDNDLCSFTQTNDICFEAGDPRANQHTLLTSLHTIFMREHNRIVTALARINPQWDGERLYQEARRIIGAYMQVITYKEYLEITLGRDRMRYFRLYILNDGTTRYDPQEDATMKLEFTTAAYRFGHSLINGLITNRPLNSSNGQRLLRNEFFQPFDLYNGVMGPLVRGASNSAAQWFDRHLVPDVTNFLYRIRGNDTGLDLASININRGRDHGIPPYVEMVRFCSEGEINVRNFDDLVRYNLMEREQADALWQNYRYVEDIDLWTGILLEIPNSGAVVGPTAACIIGMQFYALKYGDRFYFEHRDQRGSFTYDQIRELRRASLTTIICLNTDATNLPRNAMLFSSRNNPVINCRDVTGIDLSLWRE